MLDLNDDFIQHSGLFVHPGVEGKLSRESNSIHSIHPTGDEVLVGSEWGLWALAGDYTAVYGLQDQTRLPGQIVAIATSVGEGNVTVFGAAAPWSVCKLAIDGPRGQ